MSRRLSAHSFPGSEPYSTGNFSSAAPPVSPCAARFTHHRRSPGRPNHRCTLPGLPGVEPGGPDGWSSITASLPRTPFVLRQRATTRPRHRHFCITHLPDPSLAKVSPGLLFLLAHAPVVCRIPRWPVTGRRRCAATAPWPGFALLCRSPS